MPTKSDSTVIAANWKMYKTLPEALEFIDKLESYADKSSSKIMLAVPFTLIRDVSEKAKETKFIIGAQNMNDSFEGAFTGEISARMLLDAGAKFVVLGHSERRQYYKESNEFINKKVKRALSENLSVILCIGETFDEHEEGRINDVLKEQISGSLKDLAVSDFKNLMIAYEPVWAIGSGKPASVEEVARQCEEIREIVTSLWGKKVSDNLKILYGGSVNPSNAKEFLEEKNINGLFVGTASLNVDSFGKIISQT